MTGVQTVLFRSRLVPPQGALIFMVFRPNLCGDSIQLKHTPKPCSAPCSSNNKLHRHDGHPLFDVTHFESLVGAPQYLIFTWPNIAFAANSIFLFMHNSIDLHLVFAKRILGYLWGFIYMGFPLIPILSTCLHSQIQTGQGTLMITGLTHTTCWRNYQ